MTKVELSDIRKTKALYLSSTDSSLFARCVPVGHILEYEGVSGTVVAWLEEDPELGKTEPQRHRLHPKPVRLLRVLGSSDPEVDGEFTIRIEHHKLPVSLRCVEVYRY